MIVEPQFKQPNPATTTDSDSPSHIQGSSFKPLQLSSHPWVQAYRRPIPNDSEKPRLSLLALHYHMHGPDAFSEPTPGAEAKPTPGFVARRRDSQEALNEALGSPSPRVGSGAQTSLSSTGSMRPREIECLASRPGVTAAPLAALPPAAHRSEDSEVEPTDSDVEPTAPSSSSSSRSESRLTCNIYAPAGGTERVKPTSFKRRCKKSVPVHPQAISTLSGAFVDVFTSEKLFGYSQTSGEESVQLRKAKRELPN